MPRYSLYWVQAWNYFSFFRLFFKFFSLVFFTFCCVFFTWVETESIIMRNCIWMANVAHCSIVLLSLQRLLDLHPSSSSGPGWASHLVHCVAIVWRFDMAIIIQEIIPRAIHREAAPHHITSHRKALHANPLDEMRRVWAAPARD